MLFRIWPAWQEFKVADSISNLSELADSGLEALIGFGICQHKEEYQPGFLLYPVTPAGKQMPPDIQ